MEKWYRALLIQAASEQIEFGADYVLKYYGAAFPIGNEGLEQWIKEMRKL